MTRFGVPIKNILGNSYYRYRIYSSHYNTTSSTTITITCEVKDVFRRPVKDQLVTLYHQNESVESKMTDTDGVVTWEVSNLGAGLHNFQAGNATVVVRVSGWKIVATSADSYATLYVNEDARMCHLRYYRTGYNFTSTNEITLHTGLIPSAYRPPVANILSAYNVTTIGAILTNGNMTVQTSSTGSKTLNYSGVWHY